MSGSSETTLPAAWPILSPPPWGRPGGGPARQALSKSLPRATLAWIAVTLLLALTACKTERSTRMTVNDFDDMAAEMAQSLARSPMLAGRNADSPPMVVSINKVENLSSDVMSEGEQWGVIAKIRGSLPIRELRQTKNVAFVIPAEQTRRMRRRADLGGADGGF